MSRQRSPLLQQVLAHLREHGCVGVVEPGRGSHKKVRWTAPDGSQRMIVVPRYNGDWRGERHLMTLLGRKLRGEP